MNRQQEAQKLYAVHLTDSKVAEIRDMTKVDAVGPAVRSIVIKQIERHKAESAK